MLKRFILLFLFFPASLLPQSSDERVLLEADNQRFVIAPRGLLLRDAPSQSGKVIVTMAYGSAVKIFKRKHEYVEIDGATGFWAVVDFAGQVGWAYTGFMRNEVAPENGRKNWNAERSMYFIVTAVEKANECGNVQSGGCTLTVYDSHDHRIRSYSELTGAAGWFGDAVIVSGYGVCGSGGGLSQKAWWPKTNRSEDYYSDGFVNNALSPVPTGAMMTVFQCIRKECFFADLNESRHIASVFAGDVSDRRSARPLREIPYKKRVEFESINRKPLLYVDGQSFSLPDFSESHWPHATAPN